MLVSGGWADVCKMDNFYISTSSFKVFFFFNELTGHYTVLLRYAIATNLCVQLFERRCSEALCSPPDRDEVSALTH